MPVNEDIPKAYRNYCTHQSQSQQVVESVARRIYKRARRGYLANRFGYDIEDTTRVDRLLGGLIFLHPGKKAELDFEVFYLKANKGGRLLEVGCGSGSMLQLMVDRGWQAEGLDFDPLAVENARSKGLTVHLGSLESVEFPANSFDAIVMSHVIEHVSDPKALLHECMRLLRAGGELIMITPNTESFGHRVFSSSWMPLDPPRHLILFNIKNMSRLLSDCRYSDISIETTVHSADGIFYQSRDILKKGVCQLGEIHNGWSRLLFRTVQFFEWILLKIKPAGGEEIVVRAIK